MRALVVCAWIGVPIGMAQAQPVLERAPAPNGPWEEDTAAAIEETAANEWRIVTPVDDEATSVFYQVVAAEGFTAIEVTRVQAANSTLEMEALGTPATGPEERIINLPGNVPLVLVRIPAGSFQMGSPDTERSRFSDEGPVHTVTIGYDFYLGKYEVTQAQWLAVKGSWPRWAPSAKYGVGATHPAYYVGWEDAYSFITALNSHIVGTGQGPLTVRLPTEAEWEYACRAWTQTRFSFGDSLEVADLCDDDGLRSQYMWYCGNNGQEGTSTYGAKPVGTKLPNAFGLYDMHGNVLEWIEDRYHSSYAGAPADGSAWLGGGFPFYRMWRGGNWTYNARQSRSAYRYGMPSDRYPDVGFRLAAVQ